MWWMALGGLVKGQTEGVQNAELQMKQAQQNQARALLGEPVKAAQGQQAQGNQSPENNEAHDFDLARMGIG